MESSQKRCIRAGRGAAEETDHRHRLLLRAGRQRPRDGAAQQEYQLAAFHSMTSSAGAGLI
jgi:hypothetical protein